MKIRIYFFALMLMFSSMAVTTQAATKGTTKDQTEVRIKQRVDEIRAMDLSHLNKAERKDLKQELRGMKKELRSADPIIYVSGGALLLIIIILILVL